MLGLLLLDTRFPRPLGDLGLPASWPVAVETRVVPRAWPERVVRPAGELAPEVAAAFVEAARQLEDRGVDAITTSCGFLVLMQRELQAAVRVPVATSSLLQLPALLAREPQVGVLTISAAALGQAHLAAAGVPAARMRDVLVQGMDPATEFVRAILGNQPAMDLARAAREVVEAAVQLRQRAPSVRTLVLECTNLPPYARAIAAATGLDIRSLLDAPALAPLLTPSRRKP